MNVNNIWSRMFLDDRPSISLSLFRVAVALTVGFHVFPSFFVLEDTFLKTAFKTINLNFFQPEFIVLVQQSPDALVVFFAVLFSIFWFFFFIGLFSQISCVIMTLSCYYFYAINAFAIGTLSWDILIVTLFLMCVAPYAGDYFSVDSILFGDSSSYKRKRPFFAQSLLMMQVAFTYFYTGLYKITARGNWLTDNPLYYLANYPPEGVIKFFILKDFFAVHPALCYWLGIAIVLVELSMPVLLYMTKTRISAIYMAVVFHIALILTMDVPAIFFFLFPAQLLLFIPPEKIISFIERKRSDNEKTGKMALIYDGKCRFCADSVKKVKVMDLFNVVNFVDYNVTDDIQALHTDLTREKAHSQLYLVDRLGDLYGGFFAFRRLCLALPMMYILIPIFYLPGASILGPVIYKWVANNRYLFHFSRTCKDNTCFIVKNL